MNLHLRPVDGAVEERRDIHGSTRCLHLPDGGECVRRGEVQAFILIAAIISAGIEVPFRSIR